MTCSVLVVGMPSPAGCDSTKTWKAAASFVEHRLAERFGPIPAPAAVSDGTLEDINREAAAEARRLWERMASL